jgi:hypothetical protein
MAKTKKNKPEKENSVNQDTMSIGLNVPSNLYFGIQAECAKDKLKNGKKTTIHDKHIDVIKAGCKALKIDPIEL